MYTFVCSKNTKSYFKKDTIKFKSVKYMIKIELGQIRQTWAIDTIYFKSVKRHSCSCLPALTRLSVLRRPFPRPPGCQTEADDMLHQ